MKHLTQSTIALLSLLLLLLSSSSSLCQPKISYLLPDIGTPGMNTYVEIIAPARAEGGFGLDRVWLNNPNDALRVEVTNPTDSALLRIGPIVVSQNGKMISTQVFVNRNLIPNSADWEKLSTQFRIPIRVFANGSYSNSDSFYIVQPWPAINLNSSTSICCRTKIFCCSWSLKWIGVQYPIDSNSSCTTASTELKI